MPKQKKAEHANITEKESEILINKMDCDELSLEDKKIISKVLRSYIYLATMVQQAGIKLKNIRDFLFGPKTKPTKKTNSEEPKESGKDGEAESESVTDQDRPLTTPPENNKKKAAKDTESVKGHGKMPASAYTSAEHQTCHHEELKAGMICPTCGAGKLHNSRTKTKIRLHGHAPVSAICWDVDTLTCNLCNAIFDAPLPENEASGKYNNSVKTCIALTRYYMGLPFNRLEQFQKMLGIPLPDSTQWDLIKQLFDDVHPIIKVLIEIAAQSSLIHYDDTSGRILSLIEENKTLAEGARYGIHSTGFVTIGEQTIVLYFTGRSHAGENLNKLLALRNHDLPKVLAMSDASSSNKSKDYSDEIIECLCNAHSVRKFKDIKDNFPDECDLILEVMGEVFSNDKYTKLQKMTAEQRKDYHVEHSKPYLEALKIWMIEQQEKYRTIEPNSALGKAINYMLKRWESFTRFLTVPGAPLDNNIVERMLKRLIFQRKESLFFATEYSAYVGCGLLSLIMTAVEAGINSFDYLNCLQANRFEVARNPAKWLPWNYQQNVVLKAA